MAASFFGKSSQNKLDDILNWQLVDKSYDPWNSNDSEQTVATGVQIENHLDSLSKPTNPKDLIGVKKAPISVIPAGVIAEVGVALVEGAAKYGKFNYREAGVLASVYYDATMRHLMAYWEGEDIDPDSGLSHVTKAISSLVVLRDAMMQEMLEDDRPPKSKPFYPELNQKTSDIIDKYVDKKPKHVTEKNVVR